MLASWWSIHIDNVEGRSWCVYHSSLRRTVGLTSGLRRIFGPLAALAGFVRSGFALGLLRDPVHEEEKMKKSGSTEGQSASELIDKRIADLGDWRK